MHRTPTCDFTFPGGVHICPACVTRQHEQISPARRNLIFIAYGLAVLSTLLTISIERSHDPAVALMRFFSVQISTLVSLGTMERWLKNSMAIWVVVIWNLLLFALLALEVGIGLFAKP